MIIGTCGHTLTSEWHESGQGAIRIRSHDREWECTIDYIVVCPECKTWYEQEGLTLHSDKEMNEWLQGDKELPT